MMTKAVEITPVEAYRQAFQDRLDARKGEPGSLVESRQEALARFEEHGFPHAKLEAWKKTRLKRIAGTRYALAAAPGEAMIDAARAAVRRLTLKDHAARLVFIDGFHVPALSQTAKATGLEAASLARAIRKREVPLGDLQPGPDASPAALGTGPQWSLADLNLALFTDGLLLRIESDVELEAPVQLIHLATGARDPLLAALRHRVELEPRARATLLETYAGLDGGAVWTNSVMEAHLGPGARLRHYKVQREPVSADHIGLTAAEVGKDAALEDLSFSLGAGLSRHDIHVSLVGEGAHVDLNGVFLGRHNQHVDHRTTIVHAVPETTSREFYKGVMDDSGHGVFTGKIVVAKGAQHTDADQQNKNLILSRKGLVDSTPQLEIYADDVKCSHGSAIGQISADQLFYMRARGIPRERARLILTQAFAHEPLMLVPAGPLREEMADLVTQWFVAGNPEALQDAPTHSGEPQGDAGDPLALPGALGSDAGGAGSKKGKNEKGPRKD